MLHNIWVRHHLRPGVFWRLPRGEQLLLMASMEIELEPEKKPQRVVKGGRKSVVK